MNILIIGSNQNSDKDQDFFKISEQIGTFLGNSLHNVVVCSAHNSSADYHILNGLAKSRIKLLDNKILVHRPDNKEIKEQWKTLVNDLGFNATQLKYTSHQGIEIVDDRSRSFAFLLCQIKALDETDIVIFLGGNVSGSASLIASIVRHKTIPIIPFRFFGGVGEYLFTHLEGDLKARYDNNLLEKLSEPDEIENCLEILISGVKNIKFQSEVRVFLSYSWSRSELADLVEAILRRRDKVTLFRDEKDIKQGERINERIETEIKEKCNIFIALWCKEYIESPYCHDELIMWINNRRKEDLFLIRFDNTRPVWPALRQDINNRQEFNALWPKVEQERKSIESTLNQIIDNKINNLK